jgi:TonB family protein
MTKQSIILLFALAMVAASAHAQTTTTLPDDAQQGTANSNSEPEILTKLEPSDLAIMTNSYLPELRRRTMQAWLPLVPTEARSPQSKPGKVAITFHLAADGKVSLMQLTSTSGTVALDRAAWGAIVAASPYPPFPPGTKTATIDLRFTFRYNMKLK